MMSDDSALVALERWRGSLPEVSSILLGGHGYAFYRSVEGAKIDLSRADQAEGMFSRPDIKVSAAAHRARLEELLGPPLALVSAAIERSLDVAPAAAADASHVLRPAGPSPLTVFVRIVAQRVGLHTLHERPAL